MKIRIMMIIALILFFWIMVISLKKDNNTIESNIVTSKEQEIEYKVDFEYYKEIADVYIGNLIGLNSKETKEYSKTKIMNEIKLIFNKIVEKNRHKNRYKNNEDIAYKISERVYLMNKKNKLMLVGNSYLEGTYIYKYMSEKKEGSIIIVIIETDGNGVVTNVYSR